MIPWLIYYVLVIFAILCSAPIIIIWFVWLQPEPLWALLSVASISVGLILIYAWHIVNGFFIAIVNQKKRDFVTDIIND